MWTFFFLSCLLALACHGKKDFVSNVSKRFSDSYIASGVLVIPYAEIEEQFYAWFDSRNASSRIDYYGGMVKTYQLGKRGKWGSNVKIVPVTTEKVENAEKCLQDTGSLNFPATPQSVLPDLSDFEFSGKDVVNGVACDKWTRIYSYDDKINRYTMWTKSKEGLEQDTLIPVRYEMKGFNVLFGSHYDHYRLDYEFYSPETPPSEVFQVDNFTDCPSLSGLPGEHVYTFNPMKEFVQNYEEHVVAAFENFKWTHQKTYKSRKEHAKRFNLFRQNARFIHSHNRRNRGFQLKVNHLADRDDSELKVLRGNRKAVGATDQGRPFPYAPERWTETPESLDWRLNGAVTPVKDQAVCGSCWSFGTTGAVEGAYFLKNGKLLRLSQQALVDCSWGFGNNGCDGGDDVQAYDWIMKHGLPTEDDYGHYLGQDGYCHVNSTKDRVKIEGYVNVTSGDWRALRLAVAIHGPISVAIDASHKTFSFYANGIYYEPKCGNGPGQLDHAVLVVGYGKMKGEDYWLVKNSWSNYWGNDGYVLMSAKDNNCGVATEPTYVIV